MPVPARNAVLLLVALAALLSAPSSVAPQSPAPSQAPNVYGFPMKDGSVRFAVIGDTGRGDRGQYEMGYTIANSRKRFPFDFVIMLGDNLYGSDGPVDFANKFEKPYKALLDAGVKFYASLGNHDNPNQRFYKLFNMGGERYYTFRGSAGGLGKISQGGVRFFAIDSNYIDRAQLEWLAKELEASGSDWKIPFFHHPLYSSGRTHGSSLETRAALEPLFVKHGVNVVFTGHDHFYERIKPQQGILHFVVGATGSLRRGDVRATEMTAKGYDNDYSFLLVEIAGDDMHFAALSRAGGLIDSGVFRRPAAAGPPAPGPSPTAPRAPGATQAPAVVVASPSPSPGPAASPSPSPSPKPSPSPRARRPARKRPSS
jgi:hypothetical protein